MEAPHSSRVVLATLHDKFLLTRTMTMRTMPFLLICTVAIWNWVRIGPIVICIGHAIKEAGHRAVFANLRGGCANHAVFANSHGDCVELDMYRPNSYLHSSHMVQDTIFANTERT